MPSRYFQILNKATKNTTFLSLFFLYLASFSRKNSKPKFYRVSEAVVPKLFSKRFLFEIKKW